MALRRLALSSSIAAMIYLQSFAQSDFAPKVDYGTGSNPFSVVTSDLDGDGDNDLAVTNASSATVSVLKNNGDGTFAAKVDYGTGTSPISVFAADLDGDADYDLAVTNQSSATVSVLKNNGDGTFATKVDYGTGTSPPSVFASDLDGDGDKDLAVANTYSYTVSVFKNNGDGTFAPKVDYGTGDYPRVVFAADLDGDTDNDLAVANVTSNTVSVLKNNGDGTFAAKVDYVTESGPYSVFGSDLDGDGDQDLAVANLGSNTVSVLKNYGDGTFAAKVDYGTGDRPISVFAADLDGDTDFDLAVANEHSDTVSVFKNNGDGTFAAKVDYGTGTHPASVIAADLDGDADFDLAVTNQGSNTVSVLSNLHIETIKFGSEFGLTLESVTIYEVTTSTYTHTFSISDPKLQNDINEGPPNFQYDFKGTNDEFYDVYISDGDRNLDYNNGEYLTIACYHNVNLSDYGTGNNIDAVSLNFQGGTKKWAVRVGSIDLGENLFDPNLSSGLVTNALYPNDGQITYMGAHQSRMTLGFSFKTPVVLVHGWTGKSEDWSDMENRLGDDGFQNVWVVDNLNECGAIDGLFFRHNADSLNSFINRKIQEYETQTGVTVNKINIVAHSMGGLVARRFIADRNTTGTEVENLIMLGTPNGGSSLAELCVVADVYFCAHKLQCGSFCSSHFLGTSCPLLSTGKFTYLFSYLFSSCYPPSAYSAQTKFTLVAGSKYDCGLWCIFGVGSCPCDGAVGAPNVFRYFEFLPAEQLKTYPAGHSELITDIDIYTNVIKRVLHGLPPIYYQVAQNEIVTAGVQNTDSLLPQLIYINGDTVSVGGIREDTVLIDSSISTAVFSCMTSGGSFTVRLYDPLGLVVDTLALNVEYIDEENLVSYAINSPVEGLWRMEITADSITASTGAYITTVVASSAIQMTVNDTSGTASLGEYYRTEVKLKEGSIPINSANVKAIVWNYLNDVLIDSVSLFDDGLHQDSGAGDGIYANIVLVDDTVGPHSVVLQAEGIAPSGIPFNRYKMVEVDFICAVMPGDVNSSSSYTLADIISTVNYIFNKPGFPSCPSNSNLCWLSDLLCRGDWNGSGGVSLSDVIQGVNYLFNKPGGPWDPLPIGPCCQPVP